MPINLLGESLFFAAMMFSQAVKRISDNMEVGLSSQPTGYCPKTVLFPNMVRTCTKRFFSANGQPSGIHKISEESKA